MTYARPEAKNRILHRWGNDSSNSSVQLITVINYSTVHRDAVKIFLFTVLYTVYCTTVLYHSQDPSFEKSTVAENIQNRTCNLADSWECVYCTVLTCTVLYYTVRVVYPVYTYVPVLRGSAILNEGEGRNTQAPVSHNPTYSRPR